MAGTTKARVCRLAAVWAILALLCLCASAAEQTGSVKMICIASQDGQSIGLSGDTYSIVKVADILPHSLETPPLEYETLPDWLEFDCDWGNLTAGELRQKAIAMEEQAFFLQDFLDSQMIDARGEAVFENLEPGLYLVVRTFIREYNQPFLMDPFLVSVPQVEEEYRYDVQVRVKFEWWPPSEFDRRIRIGHPDVEPEEPTIPTEPPVPTEPKPTEPSPPSPNLPQTGQLQWPIPVLLASGMLLVCYGWHLEDRERKHP